MFMYFFPVDLGTESNPYYTTDKNLDIDKELHNGDDLEYCASLYVAM